MREIIKSEIKKSLGNGKVKIILGAYSKKMTEFFKRDINEISDNIFRVEEGFPKNYLFQHLSNNIGVGHRRIFVINKITNYSFIDAIINLFDGKKDVDLIVSSNVMIDYLLNDQATLVRGRIQYIVFPPFLYDDVLNQSNLNGLIEYVKGIDEDLFEGIDSYKYVQEARKIYKALINYIGYPMDLRGLYSQSKTEVSVNTFVSIFNFMLSHGFLYGIQKFNLKDRHIMPNYLYCYPTDISFIYKNADKKNGKWIAKTLETAVIAKIRNSGSLFYKAVYRNSETEENSGLLHTFIVLSSNRHYLLKIFFDNNEKSLNQFLNQKYQLPKYVLLMDDIEQYVDANGVTFVGVKQFLKKGI